MKKVILSYKFSVANKNFELAILEPRKKKWMITFKNLKGQELYQWPKNKRLQDKIILSLLLK